MKLLENMEKYTKKQSISELKEGDPVRDIFVVKIKKSIRPYSKGYSFDLILSDSSGGSLEYKYWGGPEEERVREVFSSVKADSVIFVSGKISIYNGKLQLSGDEQCVFKVLKQEEYEATFIKGPKKDAEEMYVRLISILNSVEKESIRKLLLDIVENDLKDKLKVHPGAIQIHHGWTSGLLQHILEILDMCDAVSKVYPELDRDLLITGALLHDIGKLDEIETTSRIKGTQKGQLVGHLVMGLNYLSEKLKDTNMDETLKNKLMHLIVSHHGKIEFGSPKEPMFPEALVVAMIDDLSSKTSEMLEFIKEHKEKTEDDFMYSGLNKRNIFLR